jgi:N-acetylglutamate synthase-like GNAT family acetyltransferase
MMTDIIYKTNVTPLPEQIIALYDAAGLPRPTNDSERIRTMYEHSDIIVSAWQEETLVGVARSITDKAWCCYLADLAVDPLIKKSGIGKKLIDITRELIGDECTLILLSVPTAMDYYPKVGFTKLDNCFWINRKK